MKEFAAKLAISAAIITGGIAAAQACPQTTAMSTDNTATFQLAQAGNSGGNGGGGGVGGSSAPGNSAGTSTGPSGTSTSPNTSNGGAAEPVMPSNEPLRKPIQPRVPEGAVPHTQQ